MVIRNTSGSLFPQGLTELKRVYDDFTANVPNWLTITGATSVNTDESLVITKGAVPVKIETKAINCANVDALWLELNSYRKNTANTNDSFYIKSNDGTEIIEIKNISKASSSDIGVYVNGVLFDTIPATTLVWNYATVANKPSNYAINYNILLGTLTLLYNEDIVWEKVINPIITKSKSFSVGFESDSEAITIAQIKYNIWKTL
ncbi:hypothetical protein ACF3N7_05415 [Cruoricaptor ignavus]|uniref:hypothetical protein n=1 Tax=Cruoricaptor ignavus TaxID=1118202 RepID=UPI00370CFCE1